GLARQKVNYHLRALEEHGLVELVEERRKGNMTERVMRATAASYVISPLAMSPLAPDPSRSPDRLSARWLLAVAAKLVRDVGALITGADKAGKRIATFAIDGEVRFASVADRAAFAEELATAVAGLVSKYHDETAPGGREHRIVVAVHPRITPAADDTTTTHETGSDQQ
ncbi:MAG TPA: ArsR family transcriptional regulator, partial [Micromonosporaceae bacterium]